MDIIATTLGDVLGDSSKPDISKKAVLDGDTDFSKVFDPEPAAAMPPNAQEAVGVDPIAESAGGMSGHSLPVVVHRKLSANFTVSLQVENSVDQDRADFDVGVQQSLPEGAENTSSLNLIVPHEADGEKVYTPSMSTDDRARALAEQQDSGASIVPLVVADETRVRVAPEDAKAGHSSVETGTGVASSAPHLLATPENLRSDFSGTINEATDPIGEKRSPLAATHDGTTSPPAGLPKGPLEGAGSALPRGDEKPDMSKPGANIEKPTGVGVETPADGARIDGRIPTHQTSFELVEEIVATNTEGTDQPRHRSSSPRDMAEDSTLNRRVIAVNRGSAFPETAPNLTNPTGGAGVSSEPTFKTAEHRFVAAARQHETGFIAASFAPQPLQSSIVGQSEQTSPDLDESSGRFSVFLGDHLSNGVPESKGRTEQIAITRNDPGQAQIQPSIGPQTATSPEALVDTFDREGPKQPDLRNAPSFPDGPTTSADRDTSTLTVPLAVKEHTGDSFFRYDQSDPNIKTSNRIDLPAGQQNNGVAPPLASVNVNTMVQAITQKADGAVEISLAPEELGRVRISMSQTDGPMMVVVQAERSETADLLRRNLDILAQELREAGHREVRFEFASSGQNSGTMPDGKPAPDAAHDHDGEPSGPQDEIIPIRRRALASGLDLRL